MPGAFAAVMPLAALLALLSVLPAVARSSLPTSPVVVAVVPDRVGAEEAASERYGDWHAFLDDFAATGAVRVEVLTRSAYRQAVAAPILRDGFATLFVRPDHRALVHPGMVLDPDAYRVGADWLRGTATLSEAKHWGLAPVTLILRGKL